MYQRMDNSNPASNPAQEREQALFAAALDRPITARPAFLDGACHGDPVLRARLEALLAAHEQPAAELAREAVSTVKVEPIKEPPDEAVGQTLGRYKLLEKIGEGGCGVVYVAEQTEPVRRRVALKVIKLGMDTKQVVARFEAERQALAMMDHPNIAKVLDAGMTEGSAGWQPAVSPTGSRPGVANSSVPAPPGPSQAGSPAIQQTDSRRYAAGRPYFVMELVRGIPITQYCDQEKLGTKERLDLFIKVCQAIQHAHQKGIIHRDIKPSNILVTLHDGVPVPKVIDFGIAKATEGRLTDATVYTQLHQFIGTPAYMSPEQAEMSGLDIDTRSDIYSLGVLLYELLTGKTPFDGKELMSMGIDAMRKTIREKEPPRPSTRLTQELARLGSARVPRAESGVAPDSRSSKSPDGGSSLLNEGFGGTPQPAWGTRPLPEHLRTLIHALRGDLDWIVMKCLEKDRQRRYETANGIAADLKRHLNNEPVTARPPSTGYRLQKTFRRNKLVFGAAALVAAAMLVGLIAMGFALTAQRKQALADRAASEAEDRATATARFTADLLGEAVPKLLQREDRAGIRILLDTADKMVSLQLTNSPTAEYLVRLQLALLLSQLDVMEYAKASEQFTRVEALFPHLSDKGINQPERDRLRLFAAILRLTVPHGEQQAVLQLRSLRQEFLQRDPRPRALIAGTQIWEAVAGMWGGRFDEVEHLYLSALENFSSRTGAELEDPVWLNTASFYARALVLQGKYTQAEPYARQAAGLLRRIDGERATETHSSVVWSLCGQGRFDAADEFLQSRLGSPDQWDPNQLAALEALRGTVQITAGQWQAAVPRLRDLAERAGVNSEIWKLGVLATIAAGDTNGFASLIQRGLEYYARNAHTRSAHNLLLAIGAGSPSLEMLAPTAGVIRRLEDSPFGIWTVALPLNLARLEYHRGRYAEALTLLESWQSTEVHSLVERTEHQMEKRNAHPDYLRALILARLGRSADEVAAAYRAGLERHQPAGPGEIRYLNYLMMTEQFFLNRILQAEAEQVMRSNGIAIPELKAAP
jgi:serine/threonine protein kinase/tetratricopeptide (TPR) repeat protein